MAFTFFKIQINTKIGQISPIHQSHVPGDKCGYILYVHAAPDRMLQTIAFVTTAVVIQTVTRPMTSGIRVTLAVIQATYCQPK